MVLVLLFRIGQEIQYLLYAKKNFGFLLMLQIASPKVFKKNLHQT